MKTKVLSVRLQSLVRISDKAYKASGFDGSEDILPVSQVFGRDYDVQKSDAYWIAAWILEKKNLQYSDKKIGWYNPTTGRVEPNITITVEKHIPSRKQPVNIEPHVDLNR